ncbi:MAG: bifunctional demethylmenaquinone methyltransferase/2-methoxy-6-polyprenyl-1,4-benzoquinol methylase UbiE [Chitinophagaceae bacterium]|nr:bifunctional demethylmenaquinone methyltransferase/2-methoxy-6-polyprenyl-1,4-benzoquinol methylase UbiE [Chitinophagaceae bacterium]
MNILPHQQIRPFQDSDKSKKAQVAEMFNTISGRYDFLNHFLSLQFDKRWRKIAISALKMRQPKHLLDIATGTADMAILAAKNLPDCKITGIDISEQMLEFGRKKVEKNGLKEKIDLQSGDAETIKFHDDTFDAITVAFGVRNFENLEKGLKEMHRVLKTDGVALILEFSTPKNFIIRKIYHFYMKHLAPFIARCFGQKKEAYTYLYKTSKAFPDRELFLKILQNAGFAETNYKPLSFGICCLYTAIK